MPPNPGFPWLIAPDLEDASTWHFAEGTKVKIDDEWQPVEQLISAEWDQFTEVEWHFEVRLKSGKRAQVSAIMNRPNGNVIR